MALKLHPGFVFRIVIAAALLGALAAVAGAQLAPQLPLASVLGYSLVGAACALALLVLAAVLMANISQWVLHSGGTDVQWFWFGQEPPGLAQLRADLKAQQLTVHPDPGI